MEHILMANISDHGCGALRIHFWGSLHSSLFCLTSNPWRLQIEVIYLRKFPHVIWVFSNTQSLDTITFSSIPTCFALESLLTGGYLP